MSDGDNNNSGPSNDFSKELIALVKEYPCLYDKSDSNFKNNVTKDVCWQLISIKLNQPRQECTSRWDTIRRKYTIERYKIGSPWRFLRDCDFLRNHVVVKKPPATLNKIGKVVNFKTRVRNIENYVKTIKEELRELKGAVFKDTQFKIIKQIVNAQKKPEEPQMEPKHESD